MSEPENFLARWSRRKRTAADPAEETAAKETAVEKEQPPDNEQVSSHQTPGEDEPPTFDLSRLPPIESIAAGTDIRPFLAPGVPVELTRAALRRAWMTDPGIRDFIGLSENAWDFTKAGPTGFGPLLPIDDVKKLLADIFSRQDEAKPHEAEPDSMVVAAADAKETEQRSRDVEKKIENAVPLQRNMMDQQVTADAAGQNDAPQDNVKADTDDRLVPKRSHGGALPE